MSNLSHIQEDTEEIQEGIRGLREAKIKARKVEKAVALLDSAKKTTKQARRLREIIERV